MKHLFYASLLCVCIAGTALSIKSHSDSEPTANKKLIIYMQTPVDTIVETIIKNQGKSASDFLDLQTGDARSDGTGTNPFQGFTTPIPSLGAYVLWRSLNDESYLKVFDALLAIKAIDFSETYSGIVRSGMNHQEKDNVANLLQTIARSPFLANDTTYQRMQKVIAIFLDHGAQWDITTAWGSGERDGLFPRQTMKDFLKEEHPGIYDLIFNKDGSVKKQHPTYSKFYFEKPAVTQPKLPNTPTEEKTESADELVVNLAQSLRAINEKI